MSIGNTALLKEMSLFAENEETSNLFPWPSQDTNASHALFTSGEESGAPCTPANQVGQGPVVHTKMAFHSPVPMQSSNGSVAQTPVKAQLKQKRTLHRGGLSRVTRGNQDMPNRKTRKHSKVNPNSMYKGSDVLDTPYRPFHLFPSSTSPVCVQAGSPGASQLDLMNSFSQLPYPSNDKLDFSQAETESWVGMCSPCLYKEYTEVKELGSGAFGRVALYREEATGFFVAIKSLSTSKQDARRRYNKEKTILSLVRNHPHTVQLLGAWEENSRLCLKMEYCSGGSVAALAERKRANNERWDEVELTVFLAHMCLALDALHQANIAHVDFKPDNILIDKCGAYRLSDFGCSVRLTAEGNPCAEFGFHTSRGVVSDRCSATPTWHPGLESPTADSYQHSMNSFDEGDCRYLCTDMLNQKLYVKEGDLFALGMSLYELMSGEPLPRTGEEFIELRQAPQVNHLRERGYTENLIQLIVALLRDDPLQRPSARCILQRLHPPRHLLNNMLLSESSLTQWTTNESYISQLVADGVTTPAQFRYLTASMESLTWLLETTRIAYERSNTAAGGNGTSAL